MPLTERELDLIKTSFAELRSDPQPRTAQFYEAFFGYAPHLKAMFRDDLGGQGMRFMTTLAVIVDNLHSPDALASRYADLGVAHRAMGVTVKDFEPMGRALIATLGATLGARFTPEMRAAWEKAYGQIQASIIAMGKIPES